MLGKHIMFIQAKINKYRCGDWTNNWLIESLLASYREVEFAETFLIPNSWYAKMCIYFPCDSEYNEALAYDFA